MPAPMAWPGVLECQSHLSPSQSQWLPGQAKPEQHYLRRDMSSHDHMFDLGSASTDPGHQINEGIVDNDVWHLVHLWDVQVLTP